MYEYPVSWVTMLWCLRRITSPLMQKEGLALTFDVDPFAPRSLESLVGSKRALGSCGETAALLGLHWPKRVHDQSPLSEMPEKVRLARLG